MTSPAELRALFDRELRIDIEYPGMRKEVLPHVVRFVRPASGMNFILYSWLDGADVDAVIEEQIAYFRQYSQPFEWVVYDHDSPPGLIERLTAHGFAADPDPGAVMVLDLHDAPPALLEPVTADVRPVTRREQLDDVIRIEEKVWGGDFGWIRSRMGDELEIPDYLNMYVAYVNDDPACAAWIFFYPQSQFAGLYGGSTVPEYRGQGLYTSILAVRVQEAIRRDYRYLFIDASPMSQPILARHGFQVLTVSHSCKWKGFWIWIYPYLSS